MSHVPVAYPPPPYPPPLPPKPRSKNWFATLALVAAVAGLVLCWTVAGGVAAGAAAIVLGFVARGHVRRGTADNGPVATAGIALGAVAIVVSLAVIAIWTRLYQEVDGPAYGQCIAKAGTDDTAIEKCVDDLLRRVDDVIGGSPASAR